MVAILENPPDAYMWREAVDAKYYGIGRPYGKEDWDALLGHCMVSTTLSPPSLRVSFMARHRLSISGYAEPEEMMLYKPFSTASHIESIRELS